MRDTSQYPNLCRDIHTTKCRQLEFHEGWSVLETPTVHPNLAKKVFVIQCLKSNKGGCRNNTRSCWEAWSALILPFIRSSGSAPLVNMKTITQSKLLITGWGPVQVIVHLYKYWFLLMLTLFSLYSYSASYNRSECNKESRHCHETFQQHYRSSYTLLPHKTHTNTHYQTFTGTNTSIDAV